MIVHEIHDLSNKHVTDLLLNGLAKIEESDYTKNYHPDYKNDQGNLFNLLENGRYRNGHGKYYVLEENNELVSCAGWNEYDLDKDVAMLLTRMYTIPKHRMYYHHAEHILPKILEETKHYKHQWLTMNLYNRKMYNWFLRNQEGKATSIYTAWPDIYKNFKPIGLKNIYYTDQLVAEYQK